MPVGNKKYVTAGVCLLFMFSAAMGFLVTQIQEGNYNLPEQDAILSADSQPQKPRQFRWIEEYSICARYNLTCQPIRLEGDGATEDLLREIPLTGLAERYPMPEWRISETDGTVTICHNREGLCAEHKQMYHLGINENGQYLAVYYGPGAVGSDAGVFLVTEVTIDSLNPQQYNELTKGQYEYYSQDELISVLDNFSEL